MAHEAFISYCSKDKPIADAVCAALEAGGIRCWIAPRDILPGSEWGAAIIDAIHECQVMILVFSEHANTSPQIEREVERAVHHGVAILPFRIEEVMPSGSMEYFLSTPHWMDAMTPPVEQHIERLVDTTQRLLAHHKPSTQAQPQAGTDAQSRSVSPPPPPPAQAHPTVAASPQIPTQSSPSQQKTVAGSISLRQGSNRGLILTGTCSVAVMSVLVLFIFTRGMLGGRTPASNPSPGSGAYSKPIDSSPPPRTSPTPGNQASHQGDNPLVDVAGQGDVEKVKVLLSGGADVNGRGKNGKTALMEAAEVGYPDIVRLLLDRGADITLKDDDGNTAWNIAAHRAVGETMRLLLEKGADINSTDSNGDTAWLYAADHGGLEPLALMLDKGYPIESKNSKGETALMLAASVGYVDCVKLLVQKGANVNATDSEGNTPLSLALKSPSAETVKVLQDAGAK
ncbi:MAG TPA: ankyrin repeat domain-containing protein [Chthonomonadaceae bacterium]|nr:ankyrin repeat domain-containing protein [Chthonomonadaceae bacterium]